ncbi:MAG: hypothetical protein L0Z53_28280 [Acidobacteriales bacterium]|nr:hypothetical protein [Terriglobales bacterium]
MNSSVAKSSVGNKKPLIWRLQNSIAWLDFVLEDFIRGKTKSVSGNENRVRADKGLHALREIEKDLLELFPRKQD